MELSSTKLKKLIFFLKKILIFQEGTCKARKSKVSYILWNGTLLPQILKMPYFSKKIV